MPSIGGLALEVLRPVLKPVTRIIVGSIAVPAFRMFRRKVLKLNDLDEELEKDLEQWFRSSLVLLIASRNLEQFIFGWADIHRDWLLMAGRLLLAIGVIEAMPDQQLFSIIHPGSHKFGWDRGVSVWRNLSGQAKGLFKALLCKHLNRASPVLAILAVIFDGSVGWYCYVAAISQYLIIGLVTSRDRALDVLAQLDARFREQRKEIIEEFQLAQGSEPEGVDQAGNGEAGKPGAAEGSTAATSPLPNGP